MNYLNSNTSWTNILLFFLMFFSSCGSRNNDNYEIVKITSDLAKATEKYDILSNFHNGLAKVCFNDNWGIIDRTGNEIVPCVYSSIEEVGDIFVVSKGNSGYSRRGRTFDHRKFGVINRNGEVIVPCEYSEDEFAVFPEDGLIRLKNNNNKFGFVDWEGKVVVPFEFSTIISYDMEEIIFSEGLAGVYNYKNSGKEGWNVWTYIDKRGNEVISRLFKETTPFSNGVAVVTKQVDGNSNQERFFIDKSGKTVMKFIRKDGLSGLVDNEGNEVVPCKFSYLGVYDSELIVTNDESGRQGLWNIHTKQEIIEPLYDIVTTSKYGYEYLFEHGLIKVKRNNKYGVIDKTGKEIVPCKFSYVEISNHYIEIEDKSSGYRIYGIYNHDGKEIIPCAHTQINIGPKSIALKTPNKKDSYGIISEDGSILLQCKYRHTKPFYEGLAAVQNTEDSKFGFFNEKGKLVIPFKYDNAENFSEGLAVVVLNGKHGYVNRKGEDTFNFNSHP